MATKLEELEVTSVDFVDRGANPDAHITLLKRDGGKLEAPGKKENVWKRVLSNLFKAAGIGQEEIDAALNEIEKMDTPEPTAPHSQSVPVKDVPMPSATAEQPLENTGITKNESKGESSPMVDTSKMTPSEKAFYDDIVKRYSTSDPVVEKSGKNTDDDDDDLEKCKNTKKSAEGVGKSAATLPETPPAAGAPSVSVPVAENPANGAQEDIYKGLHPAVAEELKMLRKRADEEDERRLTEVAKKYEIIGKKPEELAPLLKSLKAAGGTAYSDMISVLDASLDAVNRSGVFEEIGKSGSYSGSGDGGAWSRIEKKADEIMTANPNISRYQAIDMACMQNPSLVHEYENE